MEVKKRKHASQWVVADPTHKWFGKKVRLIANPGRGILSAYLIGYGAETEYVQGEQIKRLK